MEWLAVDLQGFDFMQMIDSYFTEIPIAEGKHLQAHVMAVGDLFGEDEDATNEEAAEPE